MMIKAGVVGVGHFGRFHAEKYARLPGVELVGVYDRNPQRALQVGAGLGARSFPNLRSLIRQIDVVSIAVPADQHVVVARECLKQGLHVLLEKPMALDAGTARTLIDLARSRQRILQIGYLERFNPVLPGLRHSIGYPTRILARRAGPYTHRGTDIDVVMDLMVHDIDLIAEIVRAPVSVSAATGAAVRSGKPDVASATLCFANACTAHLTADRVADQVQRQMWLFAPGHRLEIDFTRQSIASHRYRHGPAGQPRWLTQRTEFPPADALLLQIEDFIDCVRAGRTPRVDGEQGLRTLEIAQRIQAFLVAEQPSRATLSAYAGVSA
jgi:predicted dehydrogenase